MRKEYAKPMLYAEEFAINEHISACAHLNSTVNNGDPNQGCGFSLNGPNPGVGDPVLFLMGLEGGSSCTDAGDLSLVDPGSGGGILCYNYFVDEGTLMFQS